MNECFFLKEVAATLRLLIATYVKNRSDSFVWFNRKNPKGLSVSLYTWFTTPARVTICSNNNYIILQRQMVSLSK